VPTSQVPNPKSKLERFAIFAAIAGGIGGVVSGVMGVLGYVAPTSPDHLPHFDFFFRPVSFPAWQFVLLILGMITLAAGAYLIGKHPSKSGILPFLSVPFAKPPTAPNRQNPVPKFELIMQNSDIVIETEHQLEIHIKADNSSSVPTITLKVDNNRLDAIQELNVIVYSAYSFDSRHGQFRTHPAASGARTTLRNTILPSDSSPPVVLVHRRADQKHLNLGNDTARAMKWPENDRTAIQRWKLNISVGAREYSGTIPPSGKVFQPTRFDLIAVWNTTTGQFAVQKA
jgi:hypothetical protein